MKRTIHTDHAPKAIGPYSQAIAWNGLLFVSGQIPLDPASGQVVEGSIAEQTRRVLENIKAILEAGGSDLSKVLRTTVYLKDMAEFAAMNAVSGQFFTSQPPARATVEVSRLPRDARLEIDAVATTD